MAQELAQGMNVTMHQCLADFCQASLPEMFLGSILSGFGPLWQTALHGGVFFGQSRAAGNPVKLPEPRLGAPPKKSRDENK